MINIKDIINKVACSEKDDTLYLLEKLSDNGGLFALNGNVYYLVPNNENCSSMGIKTEFLHLETNIFISAFNPTISSFDDGFYNSIEFYMDHSVNTEDNLNAFVNLCIAHAVYMQGTDFEHFFDSLVALFQLPREQSYKNLLGTFGEIAVIEWFYKERGIDISSYWHSSGYTSKLDFVCPGCNLEVKTTVKSSTEFLIKHDQLFSLPEKNYLITVTLEENNAGISLNSLFENLLTDSNRCNSLEFAINVEKEKRHLSPNEIINKRFVIKEISAYLAKDINPFISIPTHINNLTYLLDVLPFNSRKCSDIPLGC